MKKTIIAIGGGEIKTKQTIAIDAFVAQKIKEKVGDRRPVGLFLGTAYIPYTTGMQCSSNDHWMNR